MLQLNDRIRISILMAMSLFTRLLLLGGKSLWIDECLAWGATRMGWLEMFRAVASGTPHPPLAFILFKLSALVAGDSEFGLRLVVAVLTASAVIPLYRLASRRTTPQGGFFAGLLWALSPFAVSLGQEAWVYGINAAFSLWFADAADLAWRGSSKAFAATLLLGAAGLCTQHIFVLSVAAGCVLYLSVDAGHRIPFKKFLVVPVLLGLFYAPIFLFFSSQFVARSERMVSAGFQSGPGRLFGLQPLSQYLRILAGGLIPEITGNLLERPRMLTASVLNSVVVLSLGVLPLMGRGKWNQKYLWVAVLLPFLLFLNDEPTIRHLAVLWIPFSITSAAVFSRFRAPGPVIAVLLVLSLVPYYRLHEFPYHRSNWREAVMTVEELASPGDIVIVLGGKSTCLAWEYYSTTRLPCFCPGGDQPFSGETERTGVDPGEYLRETIQQSDRGRIWVVCDLWGIRSIEEIFNRRIPSFTLFVSDDMQVNGYDGSI